MKRIISEIAPISHEPILNDKIRPLMRHYNTLRQLRGAAPVSQIEHQMEPSEHVNSYNWN